MKHYLIFLIFFLTFHCASAQDVIVTTAGDTIDCKITRITEGFLHFTIFDKSGIVLIRSRVPVSQIKYYEQTDAKVVDESPAASGIKDEDRIVLDDFEPASLRLALNTGYTYQLGGYEGMPDTYKKQVQSLWNFGGELHYFLSESIGVGAKYSYIYTKADEDFEPPLSTAFGFSSLRDEKIQFNYFAVSLLVRNFLYDDQVVNYFISGGVVRYRTDGTGDGVPFYQEGDTFGFALGVSYDFILVENFGIGLGGEINIARMSEYDNNGVVVPADFSLTRLDFTLGIRVFK